MSRFAVILPAAGRSSRFGGKEKKPFALLDGRAVWLRTVELFVTRDDVCQTLLVVAPEDRELFRTRYAPNIAFLDVQVVEGGAERFESVGNALAKLKDEAEFIAIHDAVRPCIESSLIDAVFKKAVETGAAILGVPVADTIKRADGQKLVRETLPRQGLWLAQTPQVFRRDWMAEAYANRGKLGKEITDDAQLIEAAGHTVHLVDGSPSNIKITTQGDLMLAKAILQSRPAPKRSGPSHPFAEEEMWR
jgi:2-C-methyl-D-erythritol 4-phosphate cytidylyltransferase